MEKKDVIKEVVMIFWIFVIGSVLGYLFEMTIVLFQKGYLESRQGLIYGPFTPVYGIGAVMYYLVLNHIGIKNKSKVFLICAIMGGITEYLCSFIQERVFGTISWDYSSLMFNLNGRTSLLHCTYWGIAGILYLYLSPALEKLKQNLSRSVIQMMTISLAVFMSFNIIISCAAAGRQTERKRNIAATSELDVFLDKYYPDEYMDKVYANKKEI